MTDWKSLATDPGATFDTEVFLDGFLTADGKARGRPVGVAVDATGALLVADDAGKAIWRVAPKQP